MLKELKQGMTTSQIESIGKRYYRKEQIFILGLKV